MQWNKTLNEIIGTEVFLELIVLLDINQLRDRSLFAVYDP